MLSTWNFENTQSSCAFLEDPQYQPLVEDEYEVAYKQQLFQIYKITWPLALLISTADPHPPPLARPSTADTVNEF